MYPVISRSKYNQLINEYATDRYADDIINHQVQHYVAGVEPPDISLKDQKARFKHYREEAIDTLPFIPTAPVTRPAPVATVAPVGDQRELEALRAELAALRNAPPPQPTVVDRVVERLVENPVNERLQQQIDAMTAEMTVLMQQAAQAIREKRNDGELQEILEEIDSIKAAIDRGQQRELDLGNFAIPSPPRRPRGPQPSRIPKPKPVRRKAVPSAVALDPRTQRNLEELEQLMRPAPVIPQAAIDIGENIMGRARRAIEAERSVRERRIQLDRQRDRQTAQIGVDLIQRELPTASEELRGLLLPRLAKFQAVLAEQP